MRRKAGVTVVRCFFFSSRRRHTRWTGDWSSDVCSSDLIFRIDALRSYDDCYDPDTPERNGAGYWFGVFCNLLITILYPLYLPRYPLKRNHRELQIVE